MDCIKVWYTVDAFKREQTFKDDGFLILDGILEVPTWIRTPIVHYHCPVIVGDSLIH